MKLLFYFNDIKYKHINIDALFTVNAPVYVLPAYYTCYNHVK